MQIAVIGSWDNELSPEIYNTAETVGRLIAERGGVLFTGGSTGVMQAAMKGAKSGGGLTVGMLPTEAKHEYDLIGEHIDIHIQTGMGELGKLAPLIHSADGVIAIAGGSGTLIEIAMTYIRHKPLVMIPFEGFTTARIRQYLICGMLDHRGYRPIETARDATAAVDLIFMRIAEAGDPPGTLSPDSRKP